MKAEDVTATLDLALRASGLETAKPADRPKLLSDNVLSEDARALFRQQVSFAGVTPVDQH
jgi:hypothetical protein